MADDLTTTSITTDPTLTSTLTLSTDQSDYAPGSMATFTLDGVTAGDTYDFVVTDIYGNPVSGTNLPWDVVANADGTLTTTWAVGMDALGEAFQVTVIDETTGQIATASFTDGLHPPVPADVFVGATDTGGTTVGNGLVFLTGDVNTATGTGIFPSFVQIQNTGTEDGFNTDFRPAVEDTGSSPVHNHSITLGDVPIVNVDGTDYREFRLDLNESQSSVATAQIILEALQIFGQTATGDTTVDGKLSTFTEFTGGTTGGTLNGAFEIYNMDGTDGHTGDGITDVSALLQSWASGSGHSDYKILIPNSFFANLSNSDFIYLYSKFAGADGGFEEWSVGPANPQQPPTPHAALSIDKEIVCDDGDNVTGGTVLAGSKIDFTYSLFDVGDTGSSVQGITLTDSVLGTIYANGAVDSNLAATHTVTFSGDTNNNGKLDYGENWVFTVSDLAVAGNYMNTAEVSGTDNGGVALTQDSLPATYFGADPEMQVTKLTNGVAHPDVIAGQLVTWTYTVHNIGNVDLTDLALTDNNGGGSAIAFTPSQVQVLFNGNFYNVGDTNHDGILNPGETWDFTASGTAQAVSYANTVTVDADTSIDGSVVLTDACDDSLSIEGTASSGYTGHAQTLAGLTKGYWATHLTLWDVTTGDEKGAGSELNVTPHYNWNESTGTPAITLSAITTSGSSSSLGLVKGANNGGGDSGLLLGDLNHDGLLTGDGSSGHIFFDLASAQAIANSSVSGDARLILASQAVAAQLNEYNDYVYDQTHGGPPASGFDASPTGLIEEAVQWLNGTGLLSPNHDSKINWSTTNDVAGITTIINDGTTSTNDYTLSGSAITFKSTAMSSSDASWTHFGTVLTGYTAGTDASGNPIPNPGPNAINTVLADGEGLKNALAAYNHGLDGSGGGFVISTDGSLIGWQDTAGGQVYDVHANTQDAFWGILEDQNLLGHTIVGVTGVHT